MKKGKWVEFTQKVWESREFAEVLTRLKHNNVTLLNSHCVWDMCSEEVCSSSTWFYCAWHYCVPFLFQCGPKRLGIVHSRAADLRWKQESWKNIMCSKQFKLLGILWSLWQHWRTHELMTKLDPENGSRNRKIKACNEKNLRFVCQSRHFHKWTCLQGQNLAVTAFKRMVKMLAQAYNPCLLIFTSGNTTCLIMLSVVRMCVWE